MDEFKDILSANKQAGILRHRYTKIHTTSRQWKYYINLEGSESRDKVSIDQLMALMRTKKG